MDAAEPLFARIESAPQDGSFWLDTCFVEKNGSGVQEGTWGGSIKGVIGASGLLHEYVHWIQHHGTKFGIFVFLLGHRRQEIIECFLRALRVDRRAEVLRHWRDGTALWPLVPGDDYGAFADRRDRTLRRLIDHWRALFAIEKMLLDPTSRYAKTLEPSEAFRIVELHLSGAVSVAEIAIGEESRFDVVWPSVPPDGIPSAAATPMSCWALQEAAAFLNQREFYSNASALSSEGGTKTFSEIEVATQHEAIWNSHLDDESGLYVNCIQLFEAEHPSFNINDENALAAFLAIIDVALDTPLPPFGQLRAASPCSTRPQLDFKHLQLLHPIYRFNALLEALRKIGLPRDAHEFVFDPPSYIKFCNRLKRMAGLQSRAIRCNDPIVEGDVGVWMTIPDSPLAAVKNFVLSHHSAADGVRKLFPSSFAVPTANLLYSPALRNHLTETRAESLFIAPLQILDGVGWFSGVAPDIYFDVLYSAAHGRALTSLLSAKGVPFEQGLPQDTSHHAVVERAQHDLLARLAPVA